ncbi:callose synthase 12-like [Papaver somniferum]|uniref:callose synthase 12-like n=1 Tax=Papaver somniferum TaxID=3469 RepID=UPI000E704ADD|nr:callose synthase 12-like [Papaver somniferum]
MANLRHRTQPPHNRPPLHHGVPNSNPNPRRAYNIIPIHDLIADHPSLRYPEVRAVATALKTVGDLRRPPFIQWRDEYDLLDWLGFFFGFQADNIRNQREHLVLHLANSQMRKQPPPENVDSLDLTVLAHFRKKLLSNYTCWCSYLGRKSNVFIADRYLDPRKELLYVCLFLLIWGESANIRFVPECLCYIFHHMAKDLNMILEEYPDPETGAPFIPSISGENGFLNLVITPFYNILGEEVKNSRNGTAPHSAWRNYDDINEYFWRRRCFSRLKWPINTSSNFFTTKKQGKGVGKTGYVEQRSFWNIFRSFDRLWILLILYLQAAIIVAWGGQQFPWQALVDRDVQVSVLTIFITWSGLRFLQTILDAGTQYSLVSREDVLLGVRMVLKCFVAIGWIVVFGVFYGRIWSQRNYDRSRINFDGRWSDEANRRLLNFLWAALVFVAPEVLALALFIIPWVRNILEETNWKIFYAFTWWFQTRTFVGRGLREGLVDNLKYTTFWFFTLLSKFCFSYFLQIKPLVNPTKAILKLNRIEYKWHEFFSNTNKLAIGMLWLPVILIYLMDLQIWYSIFSSLVGAMVGLFSHLGEIRNIEQLRLRFQFFSSAMQFNLMPEEQLFNDRRSLRSKVNDALHRLKLRYGLGRPYKKIEMDQVEATKFAMIWNEILMNFREEDIICDRELELMELPQNSWKIRVIRWPCLLLCNELLLALGHAKESGHYSDRALWFKVCKNEYRRCAVIEAYDSIKHLLLEIIKPRTEDHSILEKLFFEIDEALKYGKFTETYLTKLLPDIHAKFVALVELLLKSEKDLCKIATTLQALHEIYIRDFLKVKRTQEKLKEDGLASLKDASSKDLLFDDVLEIPDEEDDVPFYRQLRRLHTILTSRDSLHNLPVNLEARRRIAFFSNSLFMNMPRAPEVEKMMAFSVLTPYYNEEVVYGKEQLRTENEDGISTLFYLQKIYADEWSNFLQRMHREGMVDEEEIWTTKLRDLRLWASYRGQTLSRTVRGMMYYYKALTMLAYLDSASEMDIKDGAVGLSSMRRDSGLDGLGLHASQSLHTSQSLQGGLSRASSGVSVLFKGHEFGAAMMKFTYVVACQIYGTQKAKKDPRAEEILYLMRNNEALRVAYVDEVPIGRDEMAYFSVLVKYDQQLRREVEIYRIKLPGPLKLGEGKPENQNHAIIFTRGDAIQTIDMNQDNYFEEALKMRNLLEEYSKYYGIRKPTILGVRENVFTGSVSSLAWFMSAQETSFVTLGQRVLANPLKVRMHYGHPDVFDRFWFLSRGGISKASRVINISEDIFAGFNCTLRGGNVTHHEYIQVGKGRDVGLNQISMFEAKVASGNGEQALSRDVYRLGHRLDFFRMLSFFYTTVGFFFNTMMVIVTVYSFVWGRLYLALSGIEGSMKNSSNNKAFGAILNQQFVIQLGMFTALPMIVEYTLEHGFLPAIWDFLTMQLQLASVFYTFSMGTRTHYFGRTILHGGAKYRATGRGFVVEHKSFSENYRLYARSHFVKAIELGIILTVYAAHSPMAKDTFFYIAMTITSWFLVVSWIMAPFVFNPSGFDWLKTVYDFEEFMSWIWYKGGVFTKADQSWETWWYEEQDHLRTTGLWGKLLEIILDLRYFFFQYGVVYQLGISDGKTSIAVYLLSWIFVIFVVGIYVIIGYAQDKYAAKEHSKYRLVQWVVLLLTVFIIVILLEFTEFVVLDLLTGMLAFIPTGWGLLSIAQVIRPFLQSTVLWDTVVSLARLYDVLLGIIVLAPVALLSWLPGFQSMQTRILFNEAFSRGLQISRILAGK